MAKHKTTEPATRPTKATPEPSPEPARAPVAEPVESTAEAPMPTAPPEPEAPAGPLDETVPGGRYRTEAGIVDANGEPLKGSKKK
jgi:hypothetical protein